MRVSFALTLLLTHLALLTGLQQQPREYRLSTREKLSTSQQLLGPGTSLGLGWIGKGICVSFSSVLLSLMCMGMCAQDLKPRFHQPKSMGGGGVDENGNPISEARHTTEGSGSGTHCVLH